MMDQLSSRVGINPSSECERSSGLQKDQRFLMMDPNVPSMSGGRNSMGKQLRPMPCKPRLPVPDNCGIISSRDSSRASSALSSTENLRSPRLSVSPCPSSTPTSPHLSPRVSPRHSPRGSTHSPSHLPSPHVCTPYNPKAAPPPGVQVPSSHGGSSINNKTERLHTRYLEGRVTWLNNLAVTDEPWRTSSPRRLSPRRQLNAQGGSGELQELPTQEEERGDRYWASMSTEAQLAMRQCRGEELGLQ